MVGYDSSIVLTAGLSRPFTVRNDVVQDALNDVWRSSNYGSTWVRQTSAAPWAARFETLTFATRMPVSPRTDLLYVIGGAQPNYMLGGSDTYYNDVWASSDYGVTWALITSSAPWEGRWGHSGLVTRDGAIVFFGGAVRDDLYEEPNNYAFYGDIWASFDGGYTWNECTARTIPYNRTESAVVLDEAGHLLMAAGYSIQEPRPAQAQPFLEWHDDVIRSTFSLEQAEDGSFDGGRQLAAACGYRYPQSGIIGLQQWPAQRWNSASGAIAGVVSVILFSLVVVLCYMYTRNSVSTHGGFQWPTRREITHTLVTRTQMPDMRWVTDLPVAEQYKEQREGETAAVSAGANGGNNLSESLLGEGQQRSEGSAV